MKTQKKIAHLFLVSVYCLAVFRPVLPYAEYFLNYDFIAEILCINVEKPELECNGQCYLNDQIIKNTEAQSSDAQVPVKFEKIPELFTAKVSLPLIQAHAEKMDIPYSFSITKIYLEPDTRPPIA
jgi:hypothetical protein